MSHNPIFTIGYGARDIDAFLNSLQSYQIGYLVDVRSKPYSRYKPAFSKQPLEQALAGLGIRYVYLGDSLGGQPDDPTCYDPDGKVNYGKCRLRPQFIAGLGRLENAYAQELRVAIMCSEGKPENCHRTKLIGKALVEHGIEVRHIDENDELKSHRQVMLLVNKGQPSLFGDQFFDHTSRKAYRADNDD